MLERGQLSCAWSGGRSRLRRLFQNILTRRLSNPFFAPHLDRLLLPHALLFIKGPQVEADLAALGAAPAVELYKLRVEGLDLPLSGGWGVGMGVGG